MIKALKQQAVRFYKYGKSDQLVLDKITLPIPSAMEVLVRIIAAGVNPIDWRLREGFKQVPLPYIPGAEASGIIESIGKEVTSFEVGQEVYGAINHSYAEYAVASPEMIFLKPAHLSFEEAAAAGGGKTAWGALFEVGQLQKEQRILIHGASGGVGVFAVQLAHQAGAYVIATCSAENLSFVKSLGADEVIDYKITAFEQVVKDVNIVFDMVGGKTLENSYGIIKPGGILLSIVQPPSNEKAAHFGIRALWGGTKTVAAMRTIDELLHAGKLQPFVRKVFYSLSEAALAQDYSQQGGKGRGKVVLRVSQ